MGDESFPSLKKTLFSDDMTDYLVSVGKICDDGYVVVFDKECMKIFKTDDVMLTATPITTQVRSVNGLYPLVMSNGLGGAKLLRNSSK